MKSSFCFSFIVYIYLEVCRMRKCLFSLFYNLEFCQLSSIFKITTNVVIVWKIVFTIGPKEIVNGNRKENFHSL